MELVNKIKGVITMKTPKQVVITGASEGIGKALSLEFAQRGFFVWLVSRNAEKLEPVKEQIISCGGKADFVTCDITSYDEVCVLIEEIRKKTDCIDILINNAGLWLEGEIINNSYEQIRSVIETNLIGSILITKALLPVVKVSHHGRIVFINSLAGIEPNGDWPVYTASKYGLRGFVDSMRLALENTGIDVLSIYPGGVGTGFYKNAGYSYLSDEPWMMKVESVVKIICDLVIQKEIVISNFEIRKPKT